jgi:hypothetical protein
MRRRFLTLGLLAALPIMAAPRVEAQRVNADVWIGTGPVFGRVHVGDDPYDRYVLRRRHERSVVIVQPRIITVERIRPRGRGWSRGAYGRFRQNARVIVVYYDTRGGRWYDRPFRRGMQEVRVYERGGRYFWIDAQDRDWERDYRDRSNDRYDDRWDRRDRRGDDDDWERDWDRDDNRQPRDRDRSGDRSR